MSIWFAIKPFGSMSNPQWLMTWAKQKAKHPCMAYVKVAAVFQSSQWFSASPEYESTAAAIL